jgi:hypothetical protein
VAPSSDVDVHLRFPAERGYLRLSRINATTVAADLDFDVDELDDLRLAVDEAVSWLVSGGGGGEVLLHLTSDGGSLKVEASLSEPADDDVDTEGEGDRGVQVGDLVHAVLGATVDSYEVGLTADGRRRVELSKSAGD